MEILKATNPIKSKQQVWLQDEHNRTFADWLRKRVSSMLNDLFFMDIFDLGNSNNTFLLYAVDCLGDC